MVNTKFMAIEVCSSATFAQNVNIWLAAQHLVMNLEAVKFGVAVEATHEPPLFGFFLPAFITDHHIFYPYPLLSSYP